ncbi:MAG: hypothetical protein IJ777_01070 [Clostridia bacterium]|nr:hypothetical protein [Clostridia bacterium]
MSDLNNRYQAILKELEQNIQNEEELQFVKDKFNDLSMMFMDVIDRLTALTDMRIKSIEKTQQEMEHRMEKVQRAVDDIQSDIYEDEENYEFEITCPYCNHQFTTDIDAEFNTEVECPECHNTIELDWNDEEEIGCGSNCSHCASPCGVQEEEEDYETETQEVENNEQVDDEDM